MRKTVWTACLGVAVLLLGTASAVDVNQLRHAPGRPGLWQVQPHSNLAMFIARDLSKTPPDEQARLSEEMLKNPHAPFRICVDAKQAQDPTLAATKDSKCVPAGVRASETTLSMDMTCEGNKTMRVDVVIDSPEHRQVTVSAAFPGASVPLINTFDMRWVSDDCGNAK